MNQTLVLAVPLLGTGLVIASGQEIKDLVKEGIKKLYQVFIDKVTCKLIINVNTDHKSVYAIKEEIE
jgi:hypothetical protein